MNAAERRTAAGEEALEVKNINDADTAGVELLGDMFHVQFGVSEELKHHVQETLSLQREVEQATLETMQKMGFTVQTYVPRGELLEASDPTALLSLIQLVPQSDRQDVDHQTLQELQQVEPAWKSFSLQDLLLERQQLIAELQVKETQLLQLTEEHAELKLSLSSKAAELKRMNIYLKAELQATRSLKAAACMQKQITEKRQQIDYLQGQVKMLEETVKKLRKENQRHALVGQQCSEALTKVSEERMHLQQEVTELRSLETKLQEKVRRLEAVLDKMTEQFSECQNYMQQQEQEIVQLKLQYTLQLKELEGQTLRQTASLHSPPTCASELHIRTQPTEHMKLKTVQLAEENPNSSVACIDGAPCLSTLPSHPSPSPPLLWEGRRSPVYCLLTAAPAAVL